MSEEERRLAGEGGPLEEDERGDDDDSDRESSDPAEPGARADNTLVASAPRGGPENRRGAYDGAQVGGNPGSAAAGVVGASGRQLTFHSFYTSLSQTMELVERDAASVEGDKAKQIAGAIKRFRAEIRAIERGEAA